jgi:hypothetical protein
MSRFFVAVSAALLSAVACDSGSQSHVYVAMLYDPSGQCLDPSTTLAVVGGGDGSLLCAPTCLYELSPPAVNGVKTWVSTMCGPYPSFVNTDGTDPSCAPALQAYASAAVCGAATDAGDDGGQGSDASAEGSPPSDGSSDRSTDGTSGDGRTGPDAHAD